LPTSAPFEFIAGFLTFTGTSILGGTATAVVANSNAIGPSGAYIANLATVTDAPAGFTGEGKAQCYELPAGSGRYYLAITQLSDGQESTNRWSAGAWSGWTGSGGFSVTQYATTGDLPDPTTVPTGTIAYVPTDANPAARGLFVAEGPLNGASANAWRQQ